MTNPKNTQSSDELKQQQDNDNKQQKQHQQDKPHHQGVKEMPTSLPNQKVSSDGKKLPLTDAEKEANAS